MQLSVLPNSASLPDSAIAKGRRLPEWLKKSLPTGDVLLHTRQIVAESGVATVCEEARCPNLMECWSKKHATFMILGDKCTRRCSFCAVTTAKPDAPAADEPLRLSIAAARLGLRHMVITAVARDDLDDEGAGHFAECVIETRKRLPQCAIEVLPADFHGRPELIQLLCDAGPDIYNHNQETTERLSPKIRPAARYRRTLDVLAQVKAYKPHIFTKSGLMVGLGETREEFKQTMQDLRDVGVDILTVGQYLQPTPSHAAVARYLPPAEFDEIGAEAKAMGFASIASGPFVRSSYNAADVYAAIEQRRGA